MLCFLIPVFVALILVAFLFFKDEKFQYLIKGDSTGGGKADDMYSKIEKLEKEEVDFLYDSIRQSLNQTFSLRDGENKTILSHSAFFVTVAGFFYFLCKWTYQNYRGDAWFTVLFALLFIAFVYLVTSIAAIFRAFQVKYRLPPESKSLILQSFDHKEKELKIMLIDRWVECIVINSASNVRKMKLLTYSRWYLAFALVALLIAFVIIAFYKYYDVFMNSASSVC